MALDHAANRTETLGKQQVSSPRVRGAFKKGSAFYFFASIRGCFLSSCPFAVSLGFTCGSSQNCNEKMLLTNSLARLKVWRVRFGLFGALICLLVGCEKVVSTDEKNPVPKDAVRLLFTYSSEKEDWVTDVTATLNQGGYKTKSGKDLRGCDP